MEAVLAACLHHSQGGLRTTLTIGRNGPFKQVTVVIQCRLQEAIRTARAARLQESSDEASRPLCVPPCPLWLGFLLDVKSVLLVSGVGDADEDLGFSRQIGKDHFMIGPANPRNP